MGGNALIQKGQQGSMAEQLGNLEPPLRQIARLHDKYKIIITHGNGPQVGNLLLQQENCEYVSKQPLEILVAQTQGQIGYMIESTLDSELMALDKDHQVSITSLITYTVVDKNDPAFKNPTKPIGPAFTREQARKLPYKTVETPKGYRRVVASPIPKTIIEKREIARLIDMDFIVICCGGGGIPVVRNGNGERAFAGIDAVIDKDLATSKLAEEVGADIFIMLTDVPGVAINHGKDGETFLRRLTVSDATRYMQAGQFKAGSMAPKVTAAVNFLEKGGKRAVIAHLEETSGAIAGIAGTEFIL